MQRIATSTAVATRPTPSSTGTPGFFTKGSAAAGTPATVVSDDFLNDVQETLLAPIEGTGQTATAGKNDQLLLAIRTLAIPGAYDADLATAIGGYPLNAIVTGTTPGRFYVSTVANNMTVPGADGASWELLFASPDNGGFTGTDKTSFAWPAGLVIKTGSGAFKATSGQAGQLYDFAEPFPNACLFVHGTDTGWNVNSVSAKPVSASQFQLWAGIPGNGSTATFIDTDFNYLAVGY